MAIAKNNLGMTGSMAHVSMYKMQGSDEVIVRTKGGPSKQQIKTKPQFEIVRRNNSEWSGCTKMGSLIRLGFNRMRSVEDYPVTGALNAICKHLQKLDIQSEMGKRRILLSQYKEILLGFNFSRKQVLESVLRIPIECTLNRQTGKAQVQIPAINTDLYLYNFRKIPYFRIVGQLGGVPDMLYREDIGRYEELHNAYCNHYQSSWMPTLGYTEAINFEFEYPLTENPIPEDVTLLLSIGIEFGKMGYFNIPEPVKYAGSGKIMKVG
jgi:hypothetical protein